MQLHHLEMTAIGPFAGTESIDFAALGRTGLFLLEGPTGSGKTTIIDAITFALYNKVAASSADIERIHSHHADPRIVPTVILVFETQSGIYRVQRTPRYETPKTRGTGTTTKSPTVKLWRLSSPDDLVGELLSTSLGDVEDEITRAVGLTRDQFVQTVILPQGEFATFLRARSEDKAVLLEKVFGTAFFRRVQDEVAEAGRVAEGRRTEALAAIREAVGAFAVASDLSDDDGDELTRLAFEDPAGFRTRLDAVLTELSTAVAAATRAARTATDSHSNLEKEAHEARLRQERRETLRRLQEEDHALQSRRKGVEAKREEHRLGLQARPVAGAFRSLAHAEREVRSTTTVVATRRKLLSAQLAGLEAPALRLAAADRRRLVGSLQAAVSVEERLGTRMRERSRQETGRVAARDELDLVRQERAALPARESAVRTLIAAHERSVALGGTREQAVAAAEAALAAATALERHDKVVARLEGATQAALGAARDAEAAVAELRRRRIDGIAGELGLTLEDGQPCPVCGSPEHPSPAHPSDDAVTPEQIAAAEDDLARLHSSAQGCAEQLGEARTERARLVAASTGLDVATASQELAAARADLRDSETAARELVTATAELAELLTAQERLESRAGTLVKTLAATVQSLADLDQAIADDERIVTEARADHASVTAHIVAVEEEASRIDGYTEALVARAAAVRAEAEAQRALAADLAAARFDSEEQWWAAHREADVLQALADEIAEYDTDVTRVRTGLESKELSDLAIDALFTDVDSVVALVAQTKKAMAEANSLAGSLRDRLAGARVRRDGIEAALARSAATLAETADAVRVGRLVAGQGDNQLKMDLVKYVLIRRFTQVLAVANTELARFSGGRYSVEHTDAKQGNLRSGLGIRVHDMHTNQVREIGTLSGGETFYVSLALALALAEVVRAESGGVDLGTLFVDEGFGTLDPDVLDDVMQTLESLRAGGRTVGIVSHVSELKARVADRIEVHVRPDRTSTLSVTVD